MIRSVAFALAILTAAPAFANEGWYYSPPPYGWGQRAREHWYWRQRERERHHQWWCYHHPYECRW